MKSTKKRQNSGKNRPVRFNSILHAILSALSILLSRTVWIDVELDVTNRVAFQLAASVIYISGAEENREYQRSTSHSNRIFFWLD
jgi:hypothetical protein